MPSWMRWILEHSSKSKAKADQSPSTVPSVQQRTVTAFTPIELSFPVPQVTNSNTSTVTFNFARVFPFDIITEILGHASRVIDSDTGPRFIVSPFLLSQVCKCWQSYIHTKPSFWSSIIISLSLARRWGQPYVAGLYVWLKRAGDLPLDIYFYASCANMWPRSSLRGQIFQFVMDCRSRSRSIDIYSVDMQFVRLFESYLSPGISAYYPHLQSYITRTQDAPFLTNFQQAPALETLQINGYSDHITRWKLDPHLIKNINFTTTQHIAAYMILSSYPLLQTADIQYPFPHSTHHRHPYDRRVTIRHDHIRLLKITTKTSSYITDSLLRLEAPKLEDLQLSLPEVFNEEWLNVISSIDDFVARSGCHLVRLCLQLNLLQESLFIRMLCFLPSLEELDVHHMETLRSYNTNGGLTRAFFRKLHPYADVTIGFLSNLRILKYEGPLGIETLDPLEALVLRLLPGRQHSWPGPSSPGLGDPPARVVACQPHSTTVVRLNFAKIVAEQEGRLLSRDFTKPGLVAQIDWLVDSNALWLLSPNGSRWE